MELRTDALNVEFNDFKDFVSNFPDIPAPKPFFSSLEN